MDTTAHECEPYDTYQLCDNHVVGNEIGVAHGCAGAPLPPSFETQMEDEDAKREEEDADGDGEGCDV